MGIASQTNDELEFCAECCDLVESLNPITGWCNPCSINAGYVSPSCSSCGQVSEHGNLCSKCKYTIWLERNANDIETIMAVQFVSVRIAKKIVYANNRPICHSCRQPIKGGQKGRHFFCMKNPECIKGHNAYTYHVRHKPREEALQLAITASVIYKLTANLIQTAK